MKIGLVSDTHLNWFNPVLPNHLINSLKWVDAILHAGDLVCADVIDSMEKISETFAVYGNMDEPDLKKKLPQKRMLTFSGLKVGLIHGDRPKEIESAYLKPNIDFDAPEMQLLYDYLVRELPDADVVVFGHLHVPLVRHHAGKLLVNPGSISPYQGVRTFATLEIDHYDQPVPTVDILTL
jgi:putative phosphoesterase